MTYNAADLRRLRFDETVRSSKLAFLGLGALLGLMAGLLTGLPLSGAIEGSGALVFFAVMGLACLTLTFVMLNFLTLMTTVSDQGLEFRFGLFARRFSWDQIRAAEAKAYSWTAFLGWGVRIAPGGRRAWSLFGVPKGVEVQVVNSRGAELSYFISSARPDEMASALRRGIEERGKAGQSARVRGTSP